MSRMAPEFWLNGFLVNSEFYRQGGMQYCKYVLYGTVEKITKGDASQIKPSK